MKLNKSDAVLETVSDSNFVFKKGVNTLIGENIAGKRSLLYSEVDVG